MTGPELAALIIAILSAGGLTTAQPADASPQDRPPITCPAPGSDNTPGDGGEPGRSGLRIPDEAAPNAEDRTDTRRDGSSSNGDSAPEQPGPYNQTNAGEDRPAEPNTQDTTDEADTDDGANPSSGPEGRDGAAGNEEGSGRATEPGKRTDRDRGTPDGELPCGPAAGPGEVLDLQNWYLTLPTGADGRPDTVEQPKLGRFSNEFFRVSSDGGVEFTAPVGGVTTKNSKYPRSELREMQGDQKAAWSNASGTHTMRIRQAITQTPEQVPHVVAGQIHATSDDLMQIRLEGRRLVVKYADGKEEQLLDPDYKMGTPFDVDLTAANGTVQVAYNGEQKPALQIGGDQLYFKAGAYTQSNPEKGDRPDSAGRVVIYRLDVQHSDASGTTSAPGAERDATTSDRRSDRDKQDDKQGDKQGDERGDR